MLADLARGWKRGVWALYFALYLLPLFTVALLLASRLPGGWQPSPGTTPTPIAALLLGVAVVVSFVLASARAGLEGWPLQFVVTTGFYFLVWTRLLPTIERAAKHPGIEQQVELGDGFRVCITMPGDGAAIGTIRFIIPATAEAPQRSEPREQDARLRLKAAQARRVAEALGLQIVTQP